ncbi:MAG: hypothetical protein R3B72_45310 [Polyangiaceae bacterium]
MASEVFRFVNLRKAARPGSELEGLAAIPVANDEAPSPFYEAVRKASLSGGHRAQYERLARGFLDTSENAATGKPLALDVAALTSWVLARGEVVTRSEVTSAVQQIFERSLDELSASDEYRESIVRLRDTALAQAIVLGPRDATTAVARWLRVLTWLSAVPATTRVSTLLHRPLLLPAGIFPLPATKDPAAAADNAAQEAAATAHHAAMEAAFSLSASIAAKRTAIAELSSALYGDTFTMRRLASESGTVGVARRVPPVQPAPPAPEPVVVSPPTNAIAGGTAVLTASAVAGLSSSTKAVLAELRVPETHVDVQYAVSALERDVAQGTAVLYANATGRHTVALVGNQWLPVTGGLPGLLDPGRSWLAPGPCKPPRYDVPNAEAPTVPATTQSAIRPLGIADLMQIRQSLQRYELGEIAHVENVMASELRERVHRSASKVTQTELVETERTTEDSRDLQTTDRFELQQEAAEVVQEESSREVAMAISLSYGPFVEGSANITSSHSDSREQSHHDATRYSREVTDKAVRKVQERVLSRRSVVTETELEETNKHAFDNQRGAEHVRGVYRWLDKVYQAQVVSYGLRMVFELVLPEPAAFYKHALGVAPREGVAIDSPTVPGYCSHPTDTFVPLQPNHLNEANYQFWVSQYGASDVSPPPPLYRTIGLAASEEGAEGDRVFTYKSTELQVPEGYRAERAFVRGSAPLTVYDLSDWFMTFHVGRSHLAAGESAAMHGEDGVVPVVGHGYNVASLAFTIEVLCVRSEETFAAWQLATYTKIMSAYDDLQVQYDAALARHRVSLQNEAAVFGSRPEQNRDIERDELKRGFISLLTGQHFDLFDAMRRNVPSYGYPQMDIADALAEGSYIQFFEQAVEWSNMSYRFYPYFWGQKAGWPRALQSGADDPLFAKFLQAGAARVQVPIRPGFENAMLFLLQTGHAPWEQDEHDHAIDGA